MVYCNGSSPVDDNIVYTSSGPVDEDIVYSSSGPVDDYSLVVVLWLTI